MDSPSKRMIEDRVVAVLHHQNHNFTDNDAMMSVIDEMLDGLHALYNEHHALVSSAKAEIRAELEKHHEYGLTSEEINLLDGNKKVGAIKLVRARTGLGLKEAKDKVDKYFYRHGAPPMDAFHARRTTR